LIALKRVKIGTETSVGRTTYNLKFVAGMQQWPQSNLKGIEKRSKEMFSAIPQLVLLRGTAECVKIVGAKRTGFHRRNFP
jgi:hypothetical protein